MTSSLERLERFFSKRKNASTRSLTDTHINGSRPSTPQQSFEQHDTAFPQPSFIRPKTSRMFAREEAFCPQKSPSSSSPTSSFRPSSQMSSSDGSQRSMSLRRKLSLSSSLSLRMPNHSSTELHRRRDAPRPSQLDVFGIVTKAIDGSIDSPPSSVDEENAMSAKPSPRKLLDALPIFPRPPLDTPPPSDGDVTPKTSSFSRQSPRTISATRQLTPSPSPKSTSMHDWLCNPSQQPQEHVQSQYRSELWPARPDSPTKSAWEGFGPPSFESKRSRNMLSTKSVLKEPGVADFLSLSDEDIAETKPLHQPRAPPAALPPPPPILPPQPRYSVFPSATTSAPPQPAPTSLTLKSSAIAALEAGRIARKFDLDLLYVVNIWPSRDAELFAASGSDTATTPSAPQNKMKGRLWAAYGLQDLKPPFKLSAGVHKRALQARSWIEFRPSDPKENEFARGFACSFGAGYIPETRRGSAPGGGGGGSGSGRSSTATTDLASQFPSSSPTTTTTTTTPTGLGIRSSGGDKNCGIVFAAYRKTRKDGSQVNSGPAELAALHREADALVALLCDHNVAQKQQRSLSKKEVVGRYVC